MEEEKEKKDDNIELNIVDLDLHSIIKICEYLNYLDFRKLYESNPKFHDAIHYAVRRKCLVLPLKWESEIEAFRQIENIKFFLEKFPVHLYSFNMESENMEIVRRLTEQFNENVDQVVEEVDIMDDDVPHDYEPVPESVDHFKRIRMNLCEKIHYFAVLATPDHLRKMNLLEHVTRREINYVESLIALPRRHLDDTTYYEYLQMCHNLYGVFVLRFMPSVELLELAQCQLDCKLAEQVKNLQHLVGLTLTNVKQTSETELFFEEISKQNKLEYFALQSRERNLPGQIICQNILKMTNLKELHLSITGISFKTFLNGIAINLKNLTQLEIITRDEFELEWIIDLLFATEKLDVLLLDYNYSDRNWTKFFDELVELRTIQKKDKKLDITLFGAVEGLECMYLENELINLVLAPVVDREKYVFVCRHLMSFIWTVQAALAAQVAEIP